MMDRGLKTVLRPGPNQPRLTRLLYVAPYIRVILLKQDCLLQDYRHR